jgi:flagellar biosynthesis protein FlhB
VAEDTGQERTEQATQRRREETRKRGQVARSAEVNSAVILFSSFLVLLLFREHLLGGFRDIITGYFMESAIIELTPDSTVSLLMSVMYRYFMIIWPVFVVIAAVGVAVNILQVGFLATGEPLAPKLDKINPLTGMKRLFSRRSLETLLRDILKIVVVGWIGYSAVKGMMGEILSMAGSSAPQIIAFTGKSVFSIAMKILIGYVVLAILDYAFQRWDYENSMKMTRQEIREELKQSEGDPLLRARVRSVQREMARRRMMEQVPEAAVVITNPTEIAVALKYEAGMPAPVVVAKGRNFLAEKIRSIASEHDIPIVENVSLAQALYKAVEIGRHIPEDLFTAVAEVLAYVYQLKGKRVG